VSNCLDENHAKATKEHTTFGLYPCVSSRNAPFPTFACSCDTEGSGGYPGCLLNIPALSFVAMKMAMFLGRLRTRSLEAAACYWLRNEVPDLR
jgi:hypothetical protein